LDLLRILYSFSSISVLGILFGAGLAIAHRFLKVKKDKRIELIEKILPGVNCGACGFAGCAAYAGKIVGGEVALTLCSPGGEEVARKLAEIMGVEVSYNAQKMAAQVHCRGGKETAKYSFNYRGIKDCNALFLLGGGNKVCKFGCLGLGSCIAVCPADAIDYQEDGLVWVNIDKCISCEKCIKVCPTGVIRMIPATADYLVACSSTDKGPVIKKYCAVGCIGCKICEKKSPEGGFTVNNFLATIDYKATGERATAADKCPSHCIILNKVKVDLPNR
jgi:electron transport complex protein RnfB